MLKLTKDDVKAIARGRVNSTKIVKWLWNVWYAVVGLLFALVVASMWYVIPYMNWYVGVLGTIAGLMMFTISGLVIYKSRKIFKELEKQVKL